MCFYVNSYQPTPKVAEEDIVCYKTTQRLLNHFLFSSSLRNYVYIRNYIPRSRKLKPEGSSKNTIYKGFHSFKYEPTNTIRVGKFIIPKGTMYYENNYERVSEVLIYKGLAK